jgi:hypothetical protein
MRDPLVRTREALIVQRHLAGCGHCSNRQSLALYRGHTPMAKVHPAAPGLLMGTLDAALDGLMVQPQRPTDGKTRGILPISEQYPRPLNPACRLSSRLRY